MSNVIVPSKCVQCMWRTGVEVHCSRYRVMQSVKRDITAAKIPCADAILICRWDVKPLENSQ
jgi:hypothetical protein